MFRIALLLALLLGAGSSAFQAVWEGSGLGIDPWGSPNGQSSPPSTDTGPDADPWG
ncbi:MAG: hypothetical protein ACJ759_22505 [Thermoanaerobaculia bacterium]